MPQHTVSSPPDETDSVLGPVHRHQGRLALPRRRTVPHGPATESCLEACALTRRTYCSSRLRPVRIVIPRGVQSMSAVLPVLENRRCPPWEIPSRRDAHEHLPHVLKFSGGRSSAALAFLLAERDLLRPERGDVILFANTSAEHPATYEFARECKQRLEGDFGLPFLWFEFCTIEDASKGSYVRRPSYRLVTADPVECDPNGYRSHGEVFEEMLSYQGLLPNPHSRSCTAKLKLYPAHDLLAEWFGVGEGPRRAGHHGNRRYVTPDRALEQYRRSGGTASDDAYLRRIAYMTSRPPSRGAQRWRDFTEAPLNRPAGKPRLAPMWGRDPTLHVTLLGLRADEGNRLGRVLQRSMLAEGAGSRRCAIRTQPPGERPCFPLADWGFDQNAVRRFWQRRDFDLVLSPWAGNCVFCFMKGTKAIGTSARRPDPMRVSGAPSDIDWWVRMENKYRREVPARNGKGVSRFGFFGLRGPTFSELATAGGHDRDRYARHVPACDCTD